VFLGDLVDRGPDSAGVLRLVMGMVAAGHALAVPGNHENKLTRALAGRNVQVSHGLAGTLSQLDGEDEAFRKDVAEFCHGLVSHLVLDGGHLVVAHAGLKEAYQGRASGRVRSFALYGDTTGETDEFGLPVRYSWASDYRGRAMVLYGHTPGRRGYRRALRGKAHALAGRAPGLPRRGDGPGPLRCAGRHARGGVHPHRAAVLRAGP
jgi:protein phosphatase